MKLTKKLQADKGVSVKALIHASLAKFEQGRSLSKLHASDLTKEDHPFCPRERVLLLLTRKQPKPQYINTSLRITFQMGSSLQQLLNEVWLPDAMVGNWVCGSCGDVRSLSKRPRGHCGRQGIHCQWGYEEVRVIDAQTGTSGGLDALIDVGEPALRLLEVKSLDKDYFKALKAPMAEHLLRTQLYLSLVARSELASAINCKLGHILYISKSYGFKDDEISDGFSPFKEFTVPRNDQAVAYLLAMALAVENFKTTGGIPDGICPTSMVGRASHCPVVKECFSGMYPRQTTWIGSDNKPVHADRIVLG